MRKHKQTMTVLLLAIFSMTCGLGGTNGQGDYPKITIDDYHYNLRSGRTDTIPTHNYNIPASKGLVVDATKYDFSIIKEMNEGKEPDLIHILCESGTFVTKLDLTKETIVDETTAQNVGGTIKFTGFKKGEQAIIGLGTLKTEGEAVSFMTFWVTMIDVE